jgi:hypothetical protein
MLDHFTSSKTLIVKYAQRAVKHACLRLPAEAVRMFSVLAGDGVRRPCVCARNMPPLT